MRRHRSESIQDAIGIAEIGDGYVLRTDRVAVGLAELTPPDMQLLGADSLVQLLRAYEAVLKSTSERIVLYTYPVAPDARPLLRAIAAAQAQAPDLTSFSVLNAVYGMVQTTVDAITGIPMLRWILAVPTVQPEVPPRGMWGELHPPTVVGRLVRLRGDPVTEALNRTRRIVGALTALGTEPAPRMLSASDIRSVLRLALDPVLAHAHPTVIPDTAARPLQIASHTPVTSQGGVQHGSYSSTSLGTAECPPR